MKNLKKILLTSALLLATSCSTTRVSDELYQTDAGKKELVKTGGEVINRAKKYGFQVYVVRREGRAPTYYTEGTVREKNEEGVNVEYGYECTDNIWLFDDDIYNGIKRLKGDYTVEGINFR